MDAGFIEGYSFGEVIIEGESYTDDVILLEEKVKPGWWRQSGHLVRKSDLDKIIAYDPDLLIIGTGHSGRMSVPSDLSGKLDFKVSVFPTKKAVKKYNKMLNKEKKVAGAFHLTC